MVQCSVCNLNILVTQKRLKCVNGNCSHNYHFDCVKYNEASCPRSKWICPVCTAAKPKESDNTNSQLQQKAPSDISPLSSPMVDLDMVLLEIRNLREDMNGKFVSQEENIKKSTSTMTKLQQEIRDVCLKFSTIQEEMKEITKSVEFISTYHDEQVAKNQFLENAVIKLRDENISLTDQLRSTQFKISQLEQSARECNVEIQCIPERKTENLQEIIMALAKTVSYDIRDTDILNFHRVAKLNQDSSRPRNVIVKLISPKSRDNFLSAIKTYNKARRNDKLNSANLGIPGNKYPIYVAEHLSPENKRLHAVTRKYARENGYKFVWVRNARVFMRKDIDKPPIFVKDVDVLSKL